MPYSLSINILATSDGPAQKNDSPALRASIPYPESDHNVVPFKQIPGLQVSKHTPIAASNHSANTFFQKETKYWTSSALKMLCASA